MRSARLLLTMLTLTNCSDGTQQPDLAIADKRWIPDTRGDLGSRRDSPLIPESGRLDTTSCVSPAVSEACANGWCKVPAGCYTMGTPSDELCRQPNEAQHKVTLTHGFEVQQSEVTQAQFQSALGYNKSAFSSCGTTCPIEMVSWHEAAAYCNVLSTKAGYEACYVCTGTGQATTCAAAVAFSGSQFYACKGYRLPTDAEWEYACRAGSSSAFYNGGISTCTGSDPNANAIGWYKANASNTPHPVSGKAANGLGLSDMIGNVSEWVHDCPESSAAATTDPVCDKYPVRSLRGGSYMHDAGNSRCGVRHTGDPAVHQSHLGFRCARTL